MNGRIAIGKETFSSRKELAKESQQIPEETFTQNNYMTGSYLFEHKKIRKADKRKLD